MDELRQCVSEGYSWCRCLPVPRGRILGVALLLLLFAAITGLLGVEGAHAGTEKKRILVLNSYHKGLSWTDNIVKGIEAVLGAENIDADIDYEYLDTKRYYDEYLFQRLHDLYRQKYRNGRFDVIIVSDNDALTFVRRYYNELFPDTPVVFCGINYFQDELIEGFPRFTGVVEETDITGTIEVMLRLHPGTSRIVVVNDKTTTGIAMKKAFEAVAPRFRQAVNFVFLEDFDVRELREEIRRIAGNSLIFLLLVNRDKTGSFFAYEESLSLIRQEARVPIYSIWDFYLGRGIVGGMLTSGYYQGKTAAELAVRILRGEPATAVPIVRKSPNRYMFDYNELKRFGISVASLPRDGIIINLPDTFYARHKTVIWWFAGAVVVLSSVILILSVNIASRRKVEQALRVSEEKYRDLYDNAPDLYHTVNRDGIIVDCNETEARTLGYRKEEIIGRPITEFFTNRAKALFVRDFVRFKDERVLMNLEREFIRRDGTTFPVIINVFTEVDREGNLLRAKGIARDISERKRVEDALRASREELRNLYGHLQSVREEERRQIAREIHDELGQALTTLKLDLAVMKNRLQKEQDPLAARLQSMLGTVDGTIGTVQRISSELRPGVLDYLGLSAAIEWQVNEMTDRTGLQFDLAIDEDIVLDQEYSTAIFRIFQETLTNIVRHAGATRVEITLRKSLDTLQLEVRDNGRGITQAEAASHTAFGLIGIRERARILGGKASITAIPDQGTTVSVSIPLSRHEEGA